MNKVKVLICVFTCWHNTKLVTYNVFLMRFLSPWTFSRYFFTIYSDNPVFIGFILILPEPSQKIHPRLPVFFTGHIGKQGFWAQRCFSFNFRIEPSFRYAWRSCCPWGSSRSSHHCRPFQCCCRQAAPLLARQHQDIARQTKFDYVSDWCS